ncbi:hypothetical protein L9F63_015148 [Diploptera punctata]|uniref:Complex I assembly factor TIMMDC1, mitochondrial n=1 Tax=Diploptera punctata TaxID=6984 RepID=A0AAD8A8I6_DIPPU|nr:hypothetical protein L9F63_015148 [Diploptera punctata]
MYHNFIRNCYFSAFLPMKFFTDADKIEDSKTSQQFQDREKENESGLDRLYLMYSKDEFGGLSPELNAVMQASYMGLFVGAIYGGVSNSRIAYMNFMERNEATAFQSHFEAKKKLQDQVTVGFAKGAFRWGWRLGLFTGSYVLLTTTVAVYRGHSSLLEYIVAGSITGATYKCGLGLRGIIVGGGLGSVLGGVAGLASLGILKMSGMTMEEIRFWQYRWKQEREKQLYKGDENQADPLFKLHNQTIGSSKTPLEPLEAVPPQPEKPVK